MNLSARMTQALRCIGDTTPYGGRTRRHFARCAHSACELLPVGTSFTD